MHRAGNPVIQVRRVVAVDEGQAMDVTQHALGDFGVDRAQLRVDLRHVGVVVIERGHQLGLVVSDDRHGLAQRGRG